MDTVSHNSGERIGEHCDCAVMSDCQIASAKQQRELREMLAQRVQQGLYKEVPVERPYFSHVPVFRQKWGLLSRLRHRKEPVRPGMNRRGDGAVFWYADKWYRCTQCGALWELIEPDFPALGQLRKFEDGVYDPQ